MVNHAQDFVAVKKYEILQYSLIPTGYSIAYSGAENMADLPPITKEQDIELAQHTFNHFERSRNAA